MLRVYQLSSGHNQKFWCSDKTGRYLTSTVNGPSGAFKGAKDTMFSSGIPTFRFFFPDEGLQPFTYIGEKPLTSKQRNRYKDKNCLHHNLGGEIVCAAPELGLQLRGDPFAGASIFGTQPRPEPTLAGYFDTSTRRYVDSPGVSQQFLLLPGANWDYERGTYIPLANLRESMVMAPGGMTYHRTSVTWSSDLLRCVIIQQWQGNYARSVGQKTVSVEEYVATYSFVFDPEYHEATSMPQGWWSRKVNISTWTSLTTWRADYSHSTTKEKDTTAIRYAIGDSSSSPAPLPLDPRLEPVWLDRWFSEDIRASEDFNPSFSEIAEDCVANIRAVKTNMLEYAADVFELKGFMKQTIRSGKKLLVDGDASAIAELYLSFHYGFKLFFEDCKTIWDAITKVDFYRDKAFRVSRAASNRSFVGGRHGLIWDHSKWIKLYYGFPHDPIPDLALSAWTMGFAPTADQLWDLVPMSFVADWFVKVQDALATDTARWAVSQLSVLSCLCTSKLSTCWSVDPVVMPGHSGTISYSIYNRVVSDQLPPMVTRINTATTFNHWLEGTSLAIVLLGGHR